VTHLRLLCLGLLVSAACTGEAWSPPAGLTLRPDGGLVCGALQLTPIHCDARFRESRRAEAGQVRSGVDGWRLDGTWRFADGASGTVLETVRADGEDAVRVAWQADGGQLGFSCSLPGPASRGRELLVDDAVTQLPQVSAQPDLLAGQVRSLTLPLPGAGWIEFSGDLCVQILDHHAWGEDRFAVRIFVPPGEPGILVRSLARLTQAGPVPGAAVGVEQPTGTPLPLGAAAVTPRRDAMAKDGQGGWTDQGGNDFACLPSGGLVAAGIRFTVEDAAVLLTRTRVAHRPARAVVAGDGRHAPCLYLLHNLAWAPRQETVIGTVRIVFGDGSEALREIRSGTQVADWWNPPERLSDAVLGWQGENAQARVGAFVCRLEMPDRPIDRIELEVATDTVWAVLGLTLGPAVPLRAAPPEVIMPSERWLPTPVPFAVEPGSALDLSGLTAAPLSGPSRVLDAHVVAADGSRLRLQGVNLCNEANFPSHAEADALVAAIRAMGCNAVRFHHHDGGLALAEGDGTSLEPDQLDRLEYLIAACTRAGLYFTTDIYVSRVPPAGAIPEVAKRMRLKALIPLLPSAMDNWKRFATAWLSHRNPYTGQTLATEPGLLSLGLVNEDNLGSWVDQEPTVAALYAQRFDAWLGQQAGPAPTGGARTAAWSAWLARLQSEAHAAMSAHLRALGVRVPLTSLNWEQTWWSMAARQAFDLVDNHSYQDHPRFRRQDWRLPIDLRQDNPVDSLLRSTTSIAITRRFDRPFTVSEIQFCPPAIHRATYAAAVPAVAGTQDWDGIWRFTLGGPAAAMMTDGAIGSFAIAHDPIALLSERAVALLWRRGDVAPARWAAGLVVDPSQATSNLSAGPVYEVADLALLARIGNLSPAEAARMQSVPTDGLACLLNHPAAGDAPVGRMPVLAADERIAASVAGAGLLGADMWQAGEGRLRRADQTVDLDAHRGRLVVAGRRACAAVLPSGGEALVAGILMRNTDAETATLVVAALDDGDLATSHRLLVLHLTDAQNTATRFSSSRRTRLESWGRSPVLVRAGSCQIRLPGTTMERAFALDLAGQRREELALSVVDAGRQLDAQVARAWGPCLAWEIVR
jgi:hypothetical protein